MPDVMQPVSDPNFPSTASCPPPRADAPYHCEDNQAPPAECTKAPGNVPPAATTQPVANAALAGQPQAGGGSSNAGASPAAYPPSSACPPEAGSAPLPANSQPVANASLAGHPQTYGGSSYFDPPPAAYPPSPACAPAAGSAPSANPAPLYGDTQSTIFPTPAPYPGTTAYAAKPPKRKEPVGTKDRIFALITFLFSVLWVDFALMHSFRLGYTIATALFFVLMTVYLAGKGARLRPYPICCGLLAVAGSIPFALYQDSLIQGVSFVAILMLFALYGLQTTGIGRYSPGGYRCVADVAASLCVYPFEHMGTALRSLFSRQPAADKADGASNKTRRPIGKILIGVLCAVPVLAIVIPLMVSSDLYFEQLLSHLTFNAIDLAWRIVLGALLFPLFFTLLFAWKKRLPLTAVSSDGKTKQIDPVIIQSFLSALSVVYLVYMLTQTAYFFSAFQGLLPEGYEQSITDYVHRGFFEMCAIAAINLVILFVTMVLVRKVEGRIPRLTQALGTFLCLFTILLIGTALAKMFLYIDLYGMTRLRMITSSFMIFLVLVFLAVGIRIWKRKFPYMKMVVLAFCAVGLTVSFCDIDTTIARYNLHAYQSGQLETIDINDLERLSDGAIPYLIELLDDPDTEVAARAHNALVNKLFSHFEVVCDCDEAACPCDQQSLYQWNESGQEPAPTVLTQRIDGCTTSVELRPRSNASDLRGYNASRQQACRLLEENAERILTIQP